MERGKAALRELIVTVNPQARLSLTHREFISADAHPNVDPLNDLLRTSPQISLRPLFDQTESAIRYRTEALERTRNVKLPDLSVYYRVDAPDDQLDYWAFYLRSQSSVIESAFVKPAPELPVQLSESGLTPDPSDLLTANLTKYQTYLAAGKGIDAEYAWKLDGGRGEGVTIVDLELAWRFTHEDLQHKSGILGMPLNDLDLRNHGTAVMGMLRGIPNDIGVTGICTGAEVIPAVGDILAPSPGTADAIRGAADMLKDGDIILIELHYPGPLSNYQVLGNAFGYIPVEWWPDNLAAIEYATKCNVIVVEAGGNGGVSLDNEVYETPASPPGPFPPSWRNPFTRREIDSGAIMVGAGTPPMGTLDVTTGPDCYRLPISNFGSMFDAQGWGSHVATCGYGKYINGDKEDGWYTVDFGGTSSAAPMVAGALACIQGVLKAKVLPLLTPLEARNLLRTTGTPQGGNVSERIGGRPDLKKMIECVLDPEARALLTQPPP
jgi:hypothetical protein